MKEFINQFLKLDKTKKIIIIFITISFISIFSISVFHSFNQNQKDEIVEETKVDNEKKTENQNEENKIETQTKDKDNENQETEVKEETKKETSSSTSTQKNNQTKQTNTTENTQQSQQSNNQNNKVEEVPQKKILNISITVSGIGNIIMSDQLQVEKGATAYSVLKQTANKKGIEFEAVDRMFGKYVVNIGGLKAANYGGSANNGWIYKVNGISPTKTAANYVLKDNDYIEWVYLY